MDMEFKPGFEAVRARWSRFWKGEVSDTPMLWCQVPKSGTPAPYPNGLTFREGPLEPALEGAEAWARSYAFAGDAIPFISPQFGPDHFSLLLGADLKVHPDSPRTGWVIPCVRDWDDAPLEVEWNGYWWTRTIECLRAMRTRFDGRLIVNPPNLQGGLDCLCALRGVEPLLMDLIETPEKIDAAIVRVNRAFDAALKALYAELDLPRYGNSTRHGMFCEEPAGLPQCDFSCMINAEMFRRFALPAIDHEAKAFAQAEYHLDGPGAIRHLEDICAIPEISIIQWQPGAGAGEQKDWWDLHMRIDALGKGQMLHRTDHRFLVKAWREFRQRNQFFSTSAKTQDEAERLLDDLRSVNRSN
jgi:hypothetical protein